MFNQHISGPLRLRTKTVHRGFKNSKQFLEAVAEGDEERERQGSVSLVNKPTIEEVEEDEKEEKTNEENEDYLGDVSDKTLAAIFEQAVRCVYCPINYQPAMVALYSAEEFEYLKRALDLGRADLRAEIRSGKRRSRLILEELEQRLRQLNNHPFYKRETFKTEEDFEDWKQTEKANIEKLISQVKSIPPFSGLLHVRVLEAQDLIIKDRSNVATKPYCHVTVGKIMKPTQILEKTVAPRWDEEFTFNIGSLDDVLQIEVFDKMLIGSSYLGVVTVPMEDLQDQLPVEKLYSLTTKDKKKASGAIRLSLHLQFRQGPLIESHKDDGPSSSYASPLGFSHIDYQRAYKILLSCLINWDKNPMSQQFPRKPKKRGNE
jgi:hypothetical protein